MGQGKVITMEDAHRAGLGEIFDRVLVELVGKMEEMKMVSLYKHNALRPEGQLNLNQSCPLLAEDWPQSFKQYTQNGHFFIIFYTKRYDMAF